MITLQKKYTYEQINDTITESVRGNLYGYDIHEAHVTIEQLTNMLNQLMYEIESLEDEPVKGEK